MSSEDLNRIHERLSELGADMREVKTDLRHHIKRTEQNEAALGLLRAEVSPLKVHVAAWGGVGKALAVLGTLGGLLFGAMKVWG